MTWKKCKCESQTIELAAPCRVLWHWLAVGQIPLHDCAGSGSAPASFLRMPTLGMHAPPGGPAAMSNASCIYDGIYEIRQNHGGPLQLHGEISAEEELKPNWGAPGQEAGAAASWAGSGATHDGE